MMSLDSGENLAIYDYIEKYTRKKTDIVEIYRLK